MTQTRREWLIRRMVAPVLLVCALLLGGASAAGFAANALLQIIALGAAALILSTGTPEGIPPAAKALSCLLGLTALVIVVQLVPLPPVIWERLPGRMPVLQVFRLTGGNVGWQPLSLTPEATIGSLLSLLPPAAMILAIFASDERGRTATIMALIVVALLSWGLGTAQRLGGPNSPFYVYAITNRGSAVGLFANRNHLATLFLCSLPLLARWMPPSGLRHGIRPAILSGTALLLLGSGVLLVESRAGLALLVPTLAMTVLLILRASSRQTHARRFALAAALPCLGALAFGASLPENGGVHAMSVDAQHRAVIIPTTLRVVADYMPWGAGGGSFPTLYPSYEERDSVSTEYINHAHCDPAEFALEYGIPGLLVLSLALFLMASRTGPSWRLDDMEGTDARAALTILLIILLSSLVDYPLRTAAMASVAAMAAAMVAMPRPIAAARAFAAPQRQARSLTISAGDM